MVSSPDILDGIAETEVKMARNVDALDSRRVRGVMLRMIHRVVILQRMGGTVLHRVLRVYCDSHMVVSIAAAAVVHEYLLVINAGCGIHGGDNSFCHARFKWHISGISDSTQ